MHVDYSIEELHWWLAVVTGGGVKFNCCATGPDTINNDV